MFICLAGERFRVLQRDNEGAWIISYDEYQMPKYIDQAEFERANRIAAPEEYVNNMNRPKTKAQQERLDLLRPMLEDTRCITDKAHRAKILQETAIKHKTTAKRLRRLYYAYLAHGSLMEEIIATNEKTINFINKFALTGSVVHKYRPKNNIIILTIAVKGREIHDADYPNVVFYGEDIVSAIDKNIIVEERNFPRVHIEGLVQTTRRETPNGMRTYQSLVGNSIARTQTQMERISGISGIGSRKADSENSVCVLGQVFSVRTITRQDTGATRGVIVTLRDGSNNYPRFVCFGNQVPAAMALQNGDVVCITGFMETSTREREDGGRIRFESIIASEIAKVDVEG